jgi:hypothetical protein
MRPADEDSRTDPTFTVVIPTYNPADTIERALHSALGARHDINRLNDELETLLRSVAEARSRRVGSTS